MKIYTAKYALTEGIKEFEARESPSVPGMMYVGDQRNYTCLYFHREGRDWHRTRVEAIARAEKMRQAKIKSLRKQLDRMEKLKF